jgi:glycosyltransferase involved in cell wall biosynthesis
MPKKVLFYFRTHADAPQNIGVIDKCQAWVSAFRAAGMEADAIFFTTEGLVLNEVLWQRFFMRKKSLRHAWFYFFRADSLLRRRIDFRQYDAFIIRDLTSYPAFVRLIRHARQQHLGLRILIDFPSWPHDAEVRAWSLRWVMSAIDRHYRKKMMRMVDRAIHYGVYDAIEGVSTIKVANGIRILPVPENLPGRNDGQFSLIFVGNISYWHGLDRAIAGLNLYYQNRKTQIRITLTVIGDGAELNALKQQVTEAKLEQVVQFIPPMSREALVSHLYAADMGIGCLGLLRKQLTAAVALKHREYCAAGLPFVMAGADVDFPLYCPFVLAVPDDETPLNMIRLLNFWRYGLFDRAEIRQYALDHLSWRSKVEPTIAYLGGA